MNTSALKLFAQQSRNLLREGVEHRLTYWGFDKKGNNAASVESVGGGYTFRGKVFDDTTVPRKWNKLKAAINQLGVYEVEERAAYTWFNRLMAMKILSKNGYETAQLDYLNLDTHTPAILEKARRGQYAFLSATEKERLQKVITDYEKEEDAFGMILTGYCHQHPLLQGIFGSIDDYTELLLPHDILTKNGFLHFLNTSDAISDDDYKQVELIGWLYQFYISEKKDEVFAGFKQNKKAEAKDIPAATQIFTPNWIVKYIVQNTLGRTWLDAHPDSELRNDWKYLVEPSQPEKVEASNINLETLNFLDPAVGSGHILVEGFDTLYQMYMAEYYSADEAVESILRNNLFGLDLDLRAVQLAQFALILKAAQYSKTVLQGRLLPHIHAMPRRRNFSREEVATFLGNDHSVHVNALYKALQTMEDADNLGSTMVLELSSEARKAVEDRYQYWLQLNSTTVEEEILKEIFPTFIPILLILTKKYSCIAANPPYMGAKNMNAGLKNYVNKNYPITKSDLFAVFMDVCYNLLQNSGRYGMINQQSWMFLSSYDILREHLLAEQTIDNMLHLGPRTFDELGGEVVQNTAFILKKAKPKRRSTFIRLNNFSNTEIKAQKAIEAIQNPQCEWLFVSNQNDFNKIPGSPIAYNASQRLFKLFEENEVIEKNCKPRTGLNTGDNALYTKEWYEVSIRDILFNCPNADVAKKSRIKWFPYNKGGGFRKWYGNNSLVVNWFDDGQSIKDFAVIRNEGKHWSRFIQNTDFFFKEGITWSFINSTNFGVRYKSQGFLFDVQGTSAFPSKENLKYFIGLLCSKVSNKILSILNPTLSFQAGNVASIPFIKSDEHIGFINDVVGSLINEHKNDWDSRETSWDFMKNPLIAINAKSLKESFLQFESKISNRFFAVLANEEKLNETFIDIYRLKEELSFDVLLRDITILQEELDYEKLEELQKPYEGKLLPIHSDIVMQQLISYVVGCYMGRYRLDKPGWHIAHPNPADEELVKYTYTSIENERKTFVIDDDAIIPLMGSNASFTDDLLYRVNEFLSIVWGDETLTANLNFLQQQLGKDLEDYLVKDFWKYHTRTYSKKPIYWLFSSKRGAFQVLVYMHRMNAYTPTKIRSKYLIPHINWLKNEVSRKEKEAASLSRAELKKLDLQRKQLLECEEYDLLLKDVADKGTSFTLDDGVTKNYALFKSVVAEIK